MPTKKMHRDKNETGRPSFPLSCQIRCDCSCTLSSLACLSLLLLSANGQKAHWYHGKWTDELKLSIYPHPIKWVLYYAIHAVKWLKPSASVNWTHSSFHKQFKVCSKWYFSKSVSKQLSYLIRWLQWLSHGAVGFLVTGVWQILKQVKLKSATTSVQMGCVSVSDFVQIWPVSKKPTDSSMC